MVAAETEPFARDLKESDLVIKQALGDITQGRITLRFICQSELLSSATESHGVLGERSWTSFKSALISAINFSNRRPYST